MCTPACVAPTFCLGGTGSVAAVCETTSYTFIESFQCQSFINNGEGGMGFNTSLNSLALAEQACSMIAECTGVSDYSCNGIYNAADHYVLCAGRNHVQNAVACIYERPPPPPLPPPPASPPLPPPTACTAGSCTAPYFCHGLAGPNPTCEYTNYTYMANYQCATFIQPYDTSLVTLELAEQACSVDPACTAVSDLYCNGIYNSGDHYALCSGGGHQASSIACIWEKPLPAPPVPPPSPPPGPCNPDNCPAPSVCHGDQAIGSVRCEMITYAQSPSTQCADFLEFDAALTTLQLAEQACASDDRCGAVSDLYCNGIHPQYPNDHYTLCNGTGIVSDTFSCVWRRGDVVPPSPPPAAGSDQPAPPAPPAPPAHPCNADSCPAPSRCWGNDYLGNIICSFTSYELVANTQCVDFFADNATRTTLYAAELECEHYGRECSGVSDLFCNGIHPDVPTDHCVRLDLDPQTWLTLCLAALLSCCSARSPRIDTSACRCPVPRLQLRFLSELVRLSEAVIPAYRTADDAQHPCSAAAAAWPV